MTKEQIITQLKKDHPQIKIGSEEQGYQVLESADYDQMIEIWANDLFERLQKEQALLESRQALLNKLGITIDEAKLLIQ